MCDNSRLAPRCHKVDRMESLTREHAGLGAEVPRDTCAVSDLVGAEGGEGAVLRVGEVHVVSTELRNLAFLAEAAGTR
jgi:hypothetical protein